MLDDTQTAEVYTALSALSIVGGTMLGLVGYVGFSGSIDAPIGPAIRSRAFNFLVLGTGLFLVGTVYLAWQSLADLRER